MFKKVVLLLTVFLMFSACSCSQYKKDLKTRIKQGTEYKLISFSKLKIAVPKKANISFSDGMYTGYAGCNGMSGKYEVDAEKIKFHSGISTMMACDDMALETMFRQKLESVNNYVVKDGFVIFRKDKLEVLKFKEDN